jgi:hypothetical protein
MKNLQKIILLSGAIGLLGSEASGQITSVLRNQTVKVKMNNTAGQLDSSNVTYLKYDNTFYEGLVNVDGIDYVIKSPIDTTGNSDYLIDTLRSNIKASAEAVSSTRLDLKVSELNATKQLVDPNLFILTGINPDTVFQGDTISAPVFKRDNIVITINNKQTETLSIGTPVTFDQIPGTPKFVLNKVFGAGNGGMMYFTRDGPIPNPNHKDIGLNSIATFKINNDSSKVSLEGIKNNGKALIKDITGGNSYYVISKGDSLKPADGLTAYVDSLGLHAGTPYIALTATSIGTDRTKPNETFQIDSIGKKWINGTDTVTFTRVNGDTAFASYHGVEKPLLQGQTTSFEGLNITPNLVFAADNGRSVIRGTFEKTNPNSKVLSLDTPVTYKFGTDSAVVKVIDIDTSKTKDRILTKVDGRYEAATVNDTLKALNGFKGTINSSTYNNNAWNIGLTGISKGTSQTIPANEVTFDTPNTNYVNGTDTVQFVGVIGDTAIFKFHGIEAKITEGKEKIIQDGNIKVTINPNLVYDGSINNTDVARGTIAIEHTTGLYNKIMPVVNAKEQLTTKIYNARGQVVKTVYNEKNVGQIMQHLAPGTYILQNISGNGNKNNYARTLVQH